MRSVREVADVEDPAWPSLEDLLLDSGPSTRIVAVECAAGERCLYRLQVTARSTLGALALNTGGVSIAYGWLRLLGGGGEGLADLATVNGLGEPTATSVSPSHLLVAFDVLGGRFAVNGGALSGESGEVNYWGPDSLEWQPIGLSHSQFVSWSLTNELDQFYVDLRWQGWRDEVADVALDAGLAVYPPLCTAESRPIEATTRRAVPWTELAGQLDQLAELPEGPFRFETGP